MLSLRLLFFLAIFLFLHMPLPAYSQPDQDNKTLRIQNKTSGNLEISFKPFSKQKSAAWAQVWESYAYSADDEYDRRPDSSRDFHILPDSYIDVRCRSCDGFHYWSEIHFGRSSLLKAPQTCEIWEVDDLYKLTCSTNPRQVLGFSHVTEQRSFVFHNPNDHSVTISLRKNAGLWYSSALDNEPDTGTLQIRAQDSASVGCVKCGDAIELVAINDRKKNVRLSDGHWQIIDDGKRFPKVTRLPPGQEPPIPAPAPAAASHKIYIANGHPKKVQFWMGNRIQGKSLTTIPGGEGRLFQCELNCFVYFETPSRSPERVISPGQSYMIVWDRSTKNFDIRTYSK